MLNLRRHMFTKKNMHTIILSMALILWAELAYSQRSILNISNTQWVRDIHQGPDAFYIYGSTNSNIPDTRSDLMILKSDEQGSVSSTANYYYHPTDQLYPGNLALGKNAPAANVPEDFLMACGAFNFSGAVFNSYGAAVHVDNLNATVDWAKRTISSSISAPRCILLENGDYIFLSNNRFGAEANILMSRITKLGTVVWEKAYTMNKESGESIDFIYANDIIALQDGDFAIGGAYYSNAMSPSTSFVAIFKPNGGLVTAYGFDKSTPGASSRIVSLAQSPNGSQEIYFTGYELGTSNNKIHIGRLLPNGKLVSHHVVEFLVYEDPATESVYVQDMAIRYGSDIVNIFGTIEISGDKLTIFMRYDPVLNLVTTYDAPSPYGKESAALCAISSSDQYMTARMLAPTTAHDVCVERLNHFGDSDFCYSGGLTPIEIQYDLGLAHKIRIRGRNESFLTSYSVEQLTETISVDYCGSPFAFRLSDQQQERSKTLNTEHVSNDVKKFGESLVFQASAQFTYSIMNAFGQVVFSVQAQAGNNSIDISHLTPGIYFLFCPQLNQMMKFVK